MNTKRFREDAKSEPSVKAFMEAVERGTPLPPLYATLKRDFSGRSNQLDANGNPGAVKLILTGQRVRIVMASGFGDYGVTTVLEDDKRDEARVTLAEMMDYSVKA